MKVHAALIGIAAALALAACDRGTGPAPDAADLPPSESEYVGGAVCADCHETEAGRWQGSQHDLAMQTADASTVLGDFDDAEFEAGEITTRFFRRDGAYFVSTDGPNGAPADFVITHTFGIEPLQQYLVGLDDGRLQALNIAWDSRPAAEGGQRWFHLQPDEVIDHEDPLHWTGIYQSWNTSCADCHSTGLVKAYDPAADRFDTIWSSIDVDCEACHGPGSLHAANPAIPLPALSSNEHRWNFTPGQRIASRVPTGSSNAEIEVCAQCHSRRAQLIDEYHAGDRLLDGYRPAVLEGGLYHADGQILDEVYVYGSFLQSRMAAAGVTCSDCHDPHTTELRGESNAVCGQCHLANIYDQPAHHRHEAGTSAAECTSCHMRAETYMVVDPRRDHSFRVPRPDLSASLGSPNACNDCHQDQSSQWAAERVVEWYPEGRQSEPHYGQALNAARTWAADARALLLELIEDDGAPEIVRATAMSLLAERLSIADAEIIERSLDRDAPLLVLASIEATATLAPDRRVNLVQRFLTADTLAIRIAAARVLLTARAGLSSRRQGDLDAAMADYLAVQAFNSDRPEGLLSAAAVDVDLGRYADAESKYLLAIERHPAFGALYVNLSDLYRLMDRGDEAEAVLRQGRAFNPRDSGLDFALALALVRQGRPEEAMSYFSSAAELAPDNPYYRYVLAIAENDAGNSERSLELLRTGHERFPGNGDFLYALATLLRDAGDSAAAREYAERLVAVLPGDVDAVSLLREIEQGL